MKKMLALVMVGIIVLSFAACSKNSEKNLVGTWVVDFIEYEGSKFSVDEWKSMEEDDLSDFYIIFKDGGKAYVYDDEEGELLDWLYSDDKIMIGNINCTIIDEKISSGKWKNVPDDLEARAKYLQSKGIAITGIRDVESWLNMIEECK